jgi:hypothetical protein
MKEEILNIICRIHSKVTIPPVSDLKDLVQLSDRTQEIVRINEPTPKSCREVRRVLKKEGRLYFFYNGWCFDAFKILINSGFKNVYVIRLLKRYNRIIDLNKTSKSKDTWEERLIQSKLFLFLIKMTPGLYFFSVGYNSLNSPSFSMKIDHRSILTVLSEQNEPLPHKYIKTARSDSRGDYPLKEKFIIDWIHEKGIGIGVPEISFESDKFSTLHMNRCNGQLMTDILKKIENPDNEIKNSIKRVRKAIEVLSKAIAPEKESCRKYLTMLYTKPDKVREKAFKNYFGKNKRTIIHGDLSPANIIINNNTIYFIDWEHWRIGHAFENWFDFVFRSIWKKTKKLENHSPEYIINSFKKMLSIEWIKEETDAFFKNLNIMYPKNICLQYTLFHFFYDQIIKENSRSLMKRIKTLKLV